jgi:hypothetical protein
MRAKYQRTPLTPDAKYSEARQHDAAGKPRK